MAERPCPLLPDTGRRRPGRSMTPNLRTLEERLRYLRELDERRAVILDSISQQGKLDAALKHAIDAADSKARLDDLYLPHRSKRRTKAQIAREAGLEPLAEALLARPDQSPEQVARRYVEASKLVPCWLLVNGRSFRNRSCGELLRATLPSTGVAN